MSTALLSAILVRLAKPSPNRFARIRETGFIFVKSIAQNRFETGLTNRLRPSSSRKYDTVAKRNILQKVYQNSQAKHKMQ